MQGVAPCPICGNSCAPSRCAELWASLRNGFFRGGGGQSHSHDEEDEKVDSVIIPKMVTHDNKEDFVLKDERLFDLL